MTAPAYVPASREEVRPPPAPASAPESFLHVKVKTAEKYWVERARTNPVDFIIYMTDGEKPPAAHHLEWIRAFFDFTLRRLILEAWPSSAKTTIMIYCMAFMIGKMPWLTHMICSVSEEQAKQRLSELREIIESPRFQNVFPHIHIDLKRPNNATMFNVWSTRLPNHKEEVDYATYRQFVVRYGEKRDHTAFATGVIGKGITGKRISGIALIDDPHDSNNSATPDQRMKVTNSIRKEIVSRLSPSPYGDYTKVIIIMTPWAEDDCAGRLIESKNRDGSQIWILRKTPVRDDDGNPAWPEMWPAERIHAVEDDDGIIFDMMYMLNPVAMAGKKVTLDMLRQALPNPLPELKDITITCDFSKTEKMRSDWTVLHAVARDHHDNYFVLESRRDKKEKIDDRVDMTIAFADDIFEKHHMLTRIIGEPDAKTELQLIEQKRPDLPCEQVLIKGDKDTRFKPVEGKIQQNKFFFNTTDPVYRTMCSELIGFPKAKHDDCVDPLSLLFQQPGWILLVIRSSVRLIKSRHAI